MWAHLTRRFIALAIALATASSAHSQSQPVPPTGLTLCFEDATIAPWRTPLGKGLNFELLNAVSKAIDVPFNYQPLPWKRCLAMLKAQEVDGAFGASFNEERLEIGAYPGGNPPDPNKRLHTDKYVALRRKGGTVQWDGKQFSNLQGPVGVQLGYSIGQQLRNAGIAVDESSQSAHSLALKLIAGRVGVIAVGGSDAELLLADDSDVATQLEELPIALTEKPYYLMLSHTLVKTNNDLAQRIWKTIETVRRSPAYRKQEKRAMEELLH